MAEEGLDGPEEARAFLSPYDIPLPIDERRDVVDIRLTGGVLADARTGLDKEGGRPSAHALGFISARLFELGDLPLADAIDDALLKHGIPIQNVHHLLFAFSDNDPDALLTASLQAYQGGIPQLGVGLRVDGHAEFIGAVYERVIANANNA